MTALAEKLQLAALEAAEKLQAGMPMSTGETRTSLPPLGSPERQASVNEQWAAIKSFLERALRTAQATLDKLKHKVQRVLTTCTRMLCKRVSRRAPHRPRLTTKSANCTSSSSDSDGPAPHSHSLSHHLRAFSAQLTSVLEVLK